MQIDSFVFLTSLIMVQFCQVVGFLYILYVVCIVSPLTSSFIFVLYRPTQSVICDLGFNFTLHVKCTVLCIV